MYDIVKKFIFISTQNYSYTVEPCRQCTKVAECEFLDNKATDVFIHKDAIEFKMDNWLIGW